MVLPRLSPPPSVDQDPALPTLAAALDPSVVTNVMIPRLRKTLTPDQAPMLRSIRVLSYKPQRRCVIEYELDVAVRDSVLEPLRILGKIRANRFGKSGYRQLRAVWEAGFAGDSLDGISVPEPIGTVPRLRMWLQRKVNGSVASNSLDRPDGVRLARRIAQAVHKLHEAGIGAERRHTMDDELKILDRCLADAAIWRPDLAPRLAGLLDACTRLGGLLPTPTWCGSHRDFYPDQVLVTQDRLFLIDFDLYCEADPGLDIGNFTGHVTEQSLRARGTADALVRVEHALEEHFASLAGEWVRWSVRVYAALTIARHVYLSARKAERSHLTNTVLTTAENRVAMAMAEGGHA